MNADEIAALAGLTAGQFETVLEQCCNAVLSGQSLANTAGLGEEQIDTIYANGYQAYRDGRWQQAFEHFATLVLIAPAERLHHQALASVLQQMEQYREALLFWMYASSLEAGDPVAVFRMGECLKALGEAEEAVEAFSLALELSCESCHDAVREASRACLDSMH